MAYLHDEVPPLFLACRCLHLCLAEVRQSLWCGKFREGLLEVLKELVVDFCQLEFGWWKCVKKFLVCLCVNKLL
jgi:hypothetical protein